MVQRQPPRQEQNIYSPYYYPSFSRYNYPSKIGGDEEVYTEHKYSFPRWDDDASCTTPTTPRPRLRRASLSDLSEEDQDYFDKEAKEPLQTSQALDDDPETEQDIEQEDEGETSCEKIQVDIELARRDQKTDYDQFRKVYANLDDDLRALQREIEEIEAACLARGWDLTKDQDEIVLESESTSLSDLSTLPSFGQRYSNKNRMNRSGSFSGSSNGNGSSKSRRCLEDGWKQERVHRNEWIRC
ncbi:17548_t:CDS:1 [Acaulospora morrowiae]|uniref:17548_t:CDS:1 n=1 Tax=Acaulospora morrowiae TaxID=94023 RepID=A0A9N9FPD5_9GLOM|nr:17548_t:CDS:1 [Acaulospora morrowiae]